MAIIIGGGAYFGSFIDSKVLNDNPIFTIIFSLISIFIALYISLKSIINK
jgi:F0F1-type ATP synthase assembly protein I|tara:strand:- start:11815 stop:11964 length:150 start_codon:yes stop_codon:yes gene_type:complete